MWRATVASTPKCRVKLYSLSAFSFFIRARLVCPSIRHTVLCSFDCALKLRSSLSLVYPVLSHQRGAKTNPPTHFQPRIGSDRMTLLASESEIVPTNCILLIAPPYFLPQCDSTLVLIGLGMGSGEHRAIICVGYSRRIPVAFRRFLSHASVRRGKFVLVCDAEMSL